ncbi:MAG: primosomal protein N' [Kofleriaceae bacterium]
MTASEPTPTVAPARDTVEVLVPVAVAGRYHYRVPPHFAARAKVGARVLVRFGGKVHTGVIARVGTTPPAEVKRLLNVTDVLDEDPALSQELVDLCMWIASYYEAPPGEVIKAALPAGSAVTARRVLSLTEHGESALEGALPAKVRALLMRLEEGALPIVGMNQTQRKGYAPLIEQGYVVELEEREAARARLRQERVVELVMEVAQAKELVARAPKRLAVIDALVEGPRAISSLAIKNPSGVAREMEKLGIVKISEREVELDAVAIGEALAPTSIPTPTSEQAAAVAAITSALRGLAGEVSAPRGAETNSESARADNIVSAARGVEMSSAEASQLPSSPAPSSAPRGAETDSAETTQSSADPSSAARGVETNSAETTRSSAAPSSEPRGAETNSTEADRPDNIVSAPRGVESSKPQFVPFLLHGVTGSGKTEVYLRVIAEALELGKTALVLVPEISLTPQLAARFRARFGDQVAILHSGLKEQARLGEWMRLRRGTARIAVGARSAIFAPLENLGVIVVDEEHDGSFKQEEGVRYHARDVALVRAQRAGAVCVLGSATPSLESYAHAERGQYQLLVLSQRPTSQPMPTVEVVDLRTHVPDGEAMVSSPLRTAIGETLANGDQAILFLNRRGFATFVMCRACGHSFRCKHCSVSYTYHRAIDKLICHYCATTESIPSQCPECKQHDTIVRKGLGTEKIAEAIAEEFPQARVARLDRDVASGAKAEAVLSRVARREVDILVGTQMVTKGHDFPGVTLVGVLCADTGLDLPDFRASERTFQLLAQVAGRAGRGERAGRVIVQTYRPGSNAVVAAAAHDYSMFYKAESAARADLHYPPHGRLILIRIDGKDERAVEGVARKLARVATAASERGEPTNTVEILGPSPAPIEKVRTRTRWQVWLRSTDRNHLRRVARIVAAVEVPASVRVILDVDPNSSL